MLIAVSAFASPVLAQDTIVNNGDGKVVIIDKRPKTVVNQPNVNAQQLIKKLEESLNSRATEMYYYQELSDAKYKLLEARIEQSKAIAEREALYNNMSNKNTGILWASAGLALLLLFLYIMINNDKNKKECPADCSCKQHKHSPVINHFNVAGGYAVIDGSENLNNYQPENHYHNHIIPTKMWRDPAMAVRREQPKEKSEEVTT